MAKRSKKLQIEPQRCKHNMIIMGCAVCEKEAEMLIRYLIKMLYRPPTPKELSQMVEQIATRNPSLFERRQNEAERTGQSPTKNLA